jgi:phage baseplate assembly protein W
MSINIRFPFQDSSKGDYFDMTTTTKDAVKSDLMHLLLTNKGERLYMPDFGSDLKKFIFEPNDTTSHDDIRINLNQTISRYIPGLTINDIEFNNNCGPDENSITVSIKYSINEGVFNTSDTLEITF